MWGNVSNVNWNGSIGMDECFNRLQSLSILADIAEDTDSHCTSSPFMLTTHVDNTTSRTITLGLRNGLTFQIPPTEFTIGRNLENCVSVTYLLRIRPNVKFDIRRVLNAPDNELTDELRQIRGLVQTCEFEARTSANNLRVLEWRFSISLEQLEQASGVTYLQNLDLQISLRDTDVTPPHPYSLHESKERVMREAALQCGSGNIFAIQVVDPSAEFKTKYINLPSGPVPVTATADQSRTPGLYVVTLCRDGSTSVLKPRCDHYPLDELKDSPYRNLFYETYDLAVAHGDVVAEKERQYKLEIAKLQYEIQTSKMTLAKRADELEHQRRELELHRERMKMNQERFEYETQQRTDLIKFNREEELLRIKREDERRKEEYERTKAILDRETLQLKADAERLRNEHEINLMTIKSQSEEAKSRHDRFKLECEARNTMHKYNSERNNLILKDKNENKSHVRKNTIEIAKAIPVLVTAFLTIKAMMDKK